MVKFLSKILLLGLSIQPFSIEARLATRAEAPVEYEFYNRDVKVSQDGASEEIVESNIEILNEEGRAEFATQPLYYNSNISKLEIIEAKTIVNGKEYKIPKEMIEDKPLASSEKGFDQRHQILLSYPQVSIGAKLYLKYKFTILKQPIAEYFHTGFYYDFPGPVKSGRQTLNSAIPFHITVNDPNKSLEVKEAKENNNQTLHLFIKKPIYSRRINEPANSAREDKYITWVHSTALDNFPSLAKKLAPDYEKILHQPLPSEFEKLVNEAKGVKNLIDQVNFITSKLATNIRYMGDWKTIKGMYIPRDLSMIVETGSGDCKDYAAATVAILRKLGLNANVALVFRGVNYIESEKDLYSFVSFNHAIVKLIDEQGKVLWIDPTNFVSMAAGIFPDIANRHSLVLDVNNPSYEYIPQIDSKHARVVYDEEVYLKNEDLVEVRGKMKRIGEKALNLAGALLVTSPKALEEEIITEILGGLTPVSKKITIPDLSSRIVQDIEIGYDYEVKNISLRTNVGQGVLLNYSWIIDFINSRHDQVGALLVSEYPCSINDKFVLKNVKVIRPESLNYKVLSPWLKVTRNCKKVGNDLEIVTEAEILKTIITAEELKSKEYIKFKDNLEKHFSRTAIIGSKVQ